MTLVSAVIPCFCRPDSAVHAVRSVLGQRLPTEFSIEAVACLDGPQPEVREKLESIGDDRVVVVELPRRRGHTAARNRGIAEAQGEWIGLLDDDDSWMPDKICVQLESAALAQRSGIDLPIVACRVEARLDRGSFVWPERVPRAGELIGDYLYSRHGISSLRSGHTMVQTSMVLARRELFACVPFRAGLRRHADPDWLLRAVDVAGARVIFPEHEGPLAAWSLHEGPRVSARGDWRYSIVWARRHRHLMSPSAVAGFLSGPAAHRVGQLTRGRERLRAFAVLVRQSRRLGRPSVWDFAALVLFFLSAGRFRYAKRPHPMERPTS